jgi:hypothetical protein
MMGLHDFTFGAPTSCGQQVQEGIGPMPAVFLLVADEERNPAVRSCIKLFRITTTHFAQP